MPSRELDVKLRTLSQPAFHPPSQPPIHPLRQPSSHPPSQPYFHPRRQPSIHPLSQPSIHPLSQPSIHPQTQPSIQPLNEPSIHPHTCACADGAASREADVQQEAHDLPLLDQARRSRATEGQPRFILHPKPHTPHPAPYTLHPTPHTLHPQPYTLHLRSRRCTRRCRRALSASCPCSSRPVLLSTPPPIGPYSSLMPRVLWWS